jgi:hypothetical protein
MGVLGFTGYLLLVFCLVKDSKGSWTIRQIIDLRDHHLKLGRF